MSIPKISAIIALAGMLGLLVSAVIHAESFGDLIVTAAGACFALAALIFLGWFITESWKEIARTE